MTRLKRYVAMALCIIMALSMTVCSASADSATTKIDWYSTVTGWGPSSWDGTDTSPLLDAFKEKFGVSIAFEQPPTDADTTLGLMIVTNELPDLITVTSSDMAKQLIDSGYVWDIESFLKQYDPESHLLVDFPEDVKSSLSFTYGGWYSIPSHTVSEDGREVYPPCDEIYEATRYSSNHAIMFNETIMKALGITAEDVQTEEGFYAACEKVKTSGYQVNGQDLIPVVFHCTNWIDSSLNKALGWNFGAVPVDENGNYRHVELSPGYYNALKFANKLVQNGYLDINYLTIDETALVSYIESGRVFCWIGNSAQSSKKHEIPLVCYGGFTPSNGAVATMGCDLRAGAGWMQTFVSKNCDNPEAVAKALSFATSREGLMLNCYGVENVDYTVDEKGVVTRTAEGEKRFTEVYKSNIALWAFANTDFDRNTTAAPAEGTNEYTYLQMQTAMGAKEGNYKYDRGLVAFTVGDIIEPSSDLGVCYSQMEQYLLAQKAKIVAAADDAAFEKEYNNMVEQMKKYRVEEIDAAFNVVYQQNVEKYGDSIVDVNAELYK